MIVLCAWCLKEGAPALIGEKEPRGDRSLTHGLCAYHLAQTKIQVARYFPQLRQPVSALPASAKLA